MVDIGNLPFILMKQHHLGKKQVLNHYSKGLSRVYGYLGITN